MNKFEKMISLDEALGIVDRTMAMVKPVGETVPTHSALGRVLLADQRSRLDLPPFDKSAMDGFAVLADDERDDYEVLETVLAGHVGTKPLSAGTAIKVMTGAAVPDGAGRVIMVEQAEERDGRVRFLRRDGASNICRKGEDVQVGDLVVSAGTALRPIEIANLVACGITEIDVARRPRVSILSTGDEIVNSPDALAPGKIMNSNGPMLAALAMEHGLEIVTEERVPDNKEATENAISAAVQNSDITIISGGVSVGESDFVLGALVDLGFTVHFSRVAVQPGKPTVYATTRDGRAVFGLPGNPVAVFLMFHLFALRVVGLISARKPETRELRLRLAGSYRRKKAERLVFIPARLTETGTVEAIVYHGSAHLVALMSADGFMRVPSGVSELREGDEVTFLPIMGCGRW
ncbi:MAG: molybdopterin molybdotransferase MoeA [Armatimonadota bacterium]